MTFTSRARLCLLVATVACGGGSTAPAPTLTTLTVSLSSPAIDVGQSATATARGVDQNGAPFTLGAVTWTSSATSVATIGQTGQISAVGAGTTQITASTGGKTASATLTVTAPSAPCTGTTIRPNVGEIRTLSAADAASLCFGATTAASEYVLVAFNNSNTASATTPFQLTATNTVAVTATPNVGFFNTSLEAPDTESIEAQFRGREMQDIGALQARSRIAKRRGARASAIPATMDVGTVIQLNSNVSGNTCTSAPVRHPARLVVVLPHVMVFVDTLAPAGVYTDAELIAFANTFESTGYGLDTLTFGAVTDVDENGRVVVFFTTGVNSIPGPAGSFVGGLFAARDLISSDSLQGCVGSNEAEMFYMPVPDTGAKLNGNYRNRAGLARLVVGTLVHEFQHLINASRRIYINNANVFEQVWLNEGLSHIAEELLYYQAAGRGPNGNLTLQQIATTTPLVEAFNAYSAQNFSRLISYLAAPSTSSPFSLVDGLETRGAIWQLLRYSADRKGGDERAFWQALANSRTNGQANYNAVFGNIIEYTRDWAVAQFVDDIDLNVPARYTNPSWNFRNIMLGFQGITRFPIATSQLIGGVPLPLSVVGGGAAYVRFRLPANVGASFAATSGQAALPANIDLILVRTQ